ncbi:MAG: lectin-like protein [Campylobacterota bacterium]|nr:lectin-like protein [Campylobacterota bacterium]
MNKFTFLNTFMMTIVLFFGLTISTLWAEESLAKEDEILLRLQKIKVAGHVSKLNSITKMHFDLKEEIFVNALMHSQKKTFRLIDSLLAEEKNNISLDLIYSTVIKVLQRIDEENMTYEILTKEFENYSGLGIDILKLGMDAYAINEKNHIGTLFSELTPRNTDILNVFNRIYNKDDEKKYPNILTLASEVNVLWHSVIMNSIVLKSKIEVDRDFIELFNIRSSIIEKLIHLYKQNTDISQMDIEKILETYPSFKKATYFGKLETFKLNDIFKKNIENKLHLSGFNKIIFALDALAFINELEDTEEIKEINAIFKEYPKLVEIIIKDMEKSEYKIYNSIDLRRKMIPSAVVLNTNTPIESGLEYYKIIYFNIFIGEITQALMSSVSKIGESLEIFKNNNSDKLESDTSIEKIVFTLPQNSIMTADMHSITVPAKEMVFFKPHSNAKRFIDCINNATLNAVNESIKWRLNYTNESTSSDGTFVALQHLSNQFSFVSPSSSAIELHSLSYMTETMKDWQSCILPKNWEYVTGKSLVESTNDASANFESPETKHKYYIYDVELSWESSKSFCEKRGLHLATITTEYESIFVESWLSSLKKPYYWIGGTDSEVEGTWEWVSNEPWSYENWDSTEPNNFKGNSENYLQIYRDTGQWNDLENKDDYWHPGIICEASYFDEMEE